MSSSWGSHSKLVFDNSGQTEDLTNFPVLVTLNSGNIDYSKTQDNGEDIRFIDGTTGPELEYEIEDWNESGDSFVWVNVPQIDGSSPTDHIWLYFDNSGASDAQDAAGVWDANYVGVWHLDETGSGVADEFVDSSGTGNHGQGGAGTPGEVPTQITTGIIGNAQTFDNSDDNVNIANSASLGITGEITVSAWVKRTNMDWLAILSKTDLSSTYDYQFLVSISDTLGLWADGASPTVINTTDTITDTAWHHLSVTRNGTDDVTFYIDGAAAAGGGTQTGTYNNNADPVVIGYDGESNSAIGGSLDEVRISTIARSADWIAAQHLSMTDAFITYE